MKIRTFEVLMVALLLVVAPAVSAQMGPAQGGFHLGEDIVARY